MTTKRSVLVGLALSGSLLAAGCGSSKKADTAAPAATTAAGAATTAAGAATTAAAPATTAAAAAATTAAMAMKDGGLKGVCPDKVVVQTDWFPEAEHGATYQLMGPDAKTSKDTGATIGTLTFKGKDQGVQFEIRAGGPFLGNQTVTSQMYKDKDILLGYISTDDTVKFSNDTPVVAVVAPQDKSPQVILWDKKNHPNAKTIADIAKEVDTITVFGGATYIEYLIAAGIVPAAKVDFNYKGDKLLAKPGQEKVAHQGFATAEPFQYSVLDTGKIDIGFGLVHDAGWTLYPESLAVRADALKDDKTKACLKMLVPMFQQAQIDYIADHAAADKIIISAVNTFDTFWKQDQAATDNSVKLQKELGIVGNGKTPTLGDMEEDRLADFIKKAIPIFEAQKVTVKPGLKPSDIATNEFIDKTITYKG
jgi:hypothetical protein